jgi:hypothetical protein
VLEFEDIDEQSEEEFEVVDLNTPEGQLNSLIKVLLHP